MTITCQNIGGLLGIHIWTLINDTYFCGFILNLTSDLEFKTFRTHKPEYVACRFFVVTGIASGFE